MMFRVFVIIFSLLIFNNPAWSQLHNYLNVPNVEDVRVFEDIEETYRLPNNTRPNTYYIELRTWIHEENFSFQGYVEIAVRVLETSNRIVLHQRQLNITYYEISDLNEYLFNTSMTYDPVREFLIFEVSDENLDAESIYWLRISYVGTLRSDNGGFYRSSYVNDDGERVWLATTQFEPTDARHAFPCYDEPGIKAPIVLSIKHDPCE